MGKKRIKRTERKGSMAGSAGEARAQFNVELSNESNNVMAETYGIQHTHEPTGFSGGENEESCPNIAIESPIGPFTQSAIQTLTQLANASDSITGLMDVLKKHSKDVQNISSIKNRGAYLESKFADKDRRIEELEAAVRVLREIKAEEERYWLEKEAIIQSGRQALDEDREQFESRRRKHEKSFELRTQEQKIEYDAAVEKLKKHHNEELEEHKAQCEKYFMASMKAQETTHKDVLASLEEKSKQLTSQNTKHEKLQKEVEDLEVLREDAKSKSKHWKLKFEELRGDLGLESHPVEF
jgi:chromosome segregation ATPase